MDLMSRMQFQMLCDYFICSINFILVLFVLSATILFLEMVKQSFIFTSFDIHDKFGLIHCTTYKPLTQRK